MDVIKLAERIREVNIYYRENRVETIEEYCTKVCADVSINRYINFWTKFNRATGGRQCR